MQIYLHKMTMKPACLLLYPGCDLAAAECLITINSLVNVRKVLSGVELVRILGICHDISIPARDACTVKVDVFGVRDGNGINDASQWSESLN
jgi:hypothetical protein